MTTGPRAYVVAGLGYGDEGKGTTVDWLVRRHGADLVVRYNGGAQAAHNVVLPSRVHHTFAQFGAGSFADADTYLSRDVVVNPATMLVEADVLARYVAYPLGRLYVDEDALVTTRFHAAANRLREHARGDGRHGSCGMGINETVQDSIDFPDDAIRVRDIISPGDGKDLLGKLMSLQDRKLAEAIARGGAMHLSIDMTYEFALLARPSEPRGVLRTLCDWARQIHIVGRDWLRRRCLDSSRGVVFEGAQGMLLDQVHGCFPHVTRSDCTFANADRLLGEAGVDPTDPTRTVHLGVTRTFLTRHGAGPLPTEEPDMQHLLARDHNATGNAWQGNMRAGHLHLPSLRHAAKNVGRLDGLVVTHTDLIPHGRVPVIDDGGALVHMTMHEVAAAVGTRVVASSHGPTYLDKLEQPT